MRSGDLLIAYTDGVTEAFNPDDDEFGEDRLNELVGECAHLSVQEITECIVNAVRDWAQDTPQNDDLTLVVMKVK
jgi:sigma-B regulation protein RsbU (phosphoserine phosphatase)